MHAAKGLEFPVVYMAGGGAGHCCRTSAAWAESDEVEEERRLAFVGMTRAKEELYLCHARLREFRGQTLYAVPSMFLDELPQEAVEAIDLSASAGGTARAIEDWRGGSPAADAAWRDAGVEPRRRESAAPPGPNAAGACTFRAAVGGRKRAYAVGMLVRHDEYGVGRITDVNGHGAMRKLKVRFTSHGERTFIADKARLAWVRNGS